MIPERLLLFSAAGERLALRLAEVAEVMEPQPLFPIPRAPGHFLGLFNCHGTLTALIDLALCLGGGPGGGGKLLVLHAPGAQLALAVDGVRAIIDRDQVTAEHPAEEPLTAAHLQSAGESFRLLRLPALLDRLEQGLTGNALQGGR